jgi:hypothetical protein
MKASPFALLAFSPLGEHRNLCSQRRDLRRSLGIACQSKVLKGTYQRRPASLTPCKNAIFSSFAKRAQTQMEQLRALKVGKDPISVGTPIEHALHPCSKPTPPFI